MNTPQRINYGVFFQEWWRGTFRDPRQHLQLRTKRHCPICNFRGFFINAGHRPEARCPNCSSKERDRSIGLYLLRAHYDVQEKNILHFSAERPFFRQWKKLSGYVAGDIKKSRVSNAIVDITAIDYPENHFDLILCNHVLEHVPDDSRGMAECYRVLKKGGLAIFSVPMDVTKEETWEPPPDMPQEEIEQICGWDHVRMYGQDFKARLEKAGFAVKPLAFAADEIQKHRLCEEKDERIFLATKS